jgi:hypothetical protein
MRMSRFVIMVVLALALNANADNFCMDCIERRILHEDPGHLWYEADGECCMWPCFGYDDYGMIDEDIGSGCNTHEVSGLLVGDICLARHHDDQGSPPRGPENPDEGNGCPGAPGCNSPIILDIGDHNYRLTSVADGVRFDIRNDGHPVQMGWTRIGVDDAFLALDRNGNGTIDNGAELFGNFTPLRSGALAANGFIALAEMDDDGDQRVDASDGAWSRLLLWTDRNHDGFSAPDELLPIAASNVKAVSTDYQPIGRRDQWGNYFRYMSKFQLQKGHQEQQRTNYDVFFQIAD